MDPDEIEFLAECHPVKILPKFALPRVYLISGEVGPFEPNKLLEVPIWLAVNLKQRGKCTIVPPYWMNIEMLEQIKENEKTEKFFTAMPSEYYMVEAKLLLGCAASDIPRAEEIRTIIKDIWDIRMAKLRTSMDIFIKSTGQFARLNHLTIMEINSARPLLPHALDQLDRLSERYQQRTQSQGSTSFSNTFTIP